MDSFFGVRARNVKEFYRIVGFLKPIVYMKKWNPKQNQRLLQKRIFDAEKEDTIIVQCAMMRFLTNHFLLRLKRRAIYAILKLIHKNLHLALCYRWEGNGLCILTS